MIGEHDDADFGKFGGFENLGASAFGMVSVLGVDVKDSPKIAINAGRRGRGGPNFHPFDALRVDGGEVRGVETLDGGAGEEEGREERDGEDTHTFILRV